MKNASCVGKAPKTGEEKDLWFPEKGESPNEGKIICFTCSVRAECEDYRVRTKSEHGMWAGKIKEK